MAIRERVDVFTCDVCGRIGWMEDGYFLPKHWFAHMDGEDNEYHLCSALCCGKIQPLIEQVKLNVSRDSSDARSPGKREGLGC